MPFISDLILGSIYGFAYVLAGLALMYYARPLLATLNRQNVTDRWIKTFRILAALLMLPGLFYLGAVIVLAIRVFLLTPTKP